MDRIESAVRSLTAAVRELAAVVPAPHSAKALAHDLIQEAEDILDKQLTLEPGDATGPSAAIAAAAEHANKSDPDSVAEAPIETADDGAGPHPDSYSAASDPRVLEHPEQLLDTGSAV